MSKEKCKHAGWWFEVKILFRKRKYLWCERCLNAIPKKEVFENADILCRRASGYFMTSHEPKGSVGTVTTSLNPPLSPPIPQTTLSECPECRRVFHINSSEVGKQKTCPFTSCGQEITPKNLKVANKK